MPEGCNFVLMAPIPPSHCHGYQFRAEELNDFLEIVESFSLFWRRTGKPLLTFIWRTIHGRHERPSPCVVCSRR